MEPSVAPPRLTRRASGTCRRTRPGRERGIQSPESMARRRVRDVADSEAPDSTSISSSAGAEFQIVTPVLAMRSAQAAGSGCAAGGGRTAEAPAAKAPKRSQTERSKPREETAKTRSDGQTPK